ncbi:hypothetical protein Q8A67_023487 [Cirrhinus molitorella]|uniref:Uncharacterized protein n=1 Tax=Cirrhinus molitorella TaxID=172907 RepID=A0AA88P5V8_9TELE|nr:hypothetical protein Q8A67_023487 [Cirrhinus molitorella]
MTERVRSQALKPSLRIKCQTRKSNKNPPAIPSCTTIGPPFEVASLNLSAQELTGSRVSFGLPVQPS